MGPWSRMPPGGLQVQQPQEATGRGGDLGQSHGVAGLGHIWDYASGSGIAVHIYASHMLSCRMEHPSRRFNPANSYLLFKALFNFFPQSSGQDRSSFQAAHRRTRLSCAASPSGRELPLRKEQQASGFPCQVRV